MSMGVGHLNNNQVVVYLTDWRGWHLGKGIVNPFKLGLTPDHGHRRVSKQAKFAIGKTCAKFFHTEAIPDAKVDNSYFVVIQGNTKMG
jgi:hypothetical protein